MSYDGSDSYGKGTYGESYGDYDGKSFGGYGKGKGKDFGKDFKGQESKGKDGKGKFGKGKRRPTGPNLPRTRITEQPVTGEVAEWKGKYGWIMPAVPVEHPKWKGKLYISMMPQFL